MDGSVFSDKNVQISSLYFFYRFLFFPGSSAHKLYHKQKAHVLLYNVVQRLLCTLCTVSLMATSTSVKHMGKIHKFNIQISVFCMDEVKMLFLFTFSYLIFTDDRKRNDTSSLIILTLTMANFLNGIIQLPFLALSIIILRDIKMKT